MPTAIHLDRPVDCPPPYHPRGFRMRYYRIYYNLWKFDVYGIRGPHKWRFGFGWSIVIYRLCIHGYAISPFYKRFPYELR